MEGRAQRAFYMLKLLNAGPAGSMVAFEDVVWKTLIMVAIRVARNFRLSRPNLLGYFQKPLQNDFEAHHRRVAECSARGRL